MEAGCQEDPAQLGDQRLAKVSEEKLYTFIYINLYTFVK